MPSTRSYPFRRLGVDHMIVGSSRIWWQLEPSFHEPGPHVFQLQFGRTGNQNAHDWVNVGLPLEDAFYATDDAQRDFGKILTAHYRVALTTGTSTYVSLPTSCIGQLPEKDWLEAREIMRKERLRHSIVSPEGVLLRRFRYGTRCTKCLDFLTEDITNSECPECNGTGFVIGYHPPVPCQCYDLSPLSIDESQNEEQGTVQEEGDGTLVKARVIGFPMLQKLDVWVNCSSDERWIIHRVTRGACVRNVPVVLDVEMRLAPFTHQVYKLSLEDAGDDVTSPGPGDGDIVVDQDFGGDDNLSYVLATGEGVEGATMLAFKHSDYQAAQPGRPAASLAVAGTMTVGGGRWEEAVNLNPGAYVLVFEKPGHFGPDIISINIPKPVTTSSSIPSSSAPDDGFWDV